VTVKNKNLPATRSNGALAPVDDAQKAMAVFTDDLEEFLSTPFLSPRGAAKCGAIVTILRAAERLADAVDAEEGAEPEVQYTYLCELQTPASYENNAGEHIEFAKGDRVLVALKKNRIREAIFNKIGEVLRDFGAIANMQLVILKQSAKGKAKGHSPAIGFKPVTA